ncbi:MAG: hypothetical protein UU09_C0016G0013 [Microgenomates group bacterium GW2011_GWA2_40_6]|nr:MAG: hypothetical protein UU09_C0016G0013 [Microgenomates group bacterium GW2011_GWA2_40_6]
MSENKTKIDLNLMPSQAKFQAARMKMKELSRKVITIMAVGWLLAVLLMLIVWFSVKWWLTVEKNKYQKEINAFSSMSDSVVTSQVIKYRAKLLGKILVDRFEYYEAFSKIGKLFPEEVTVKDISLKDESIFRLSLLVSRGQLLDQVEKRIEEINKGEVPGIRQIKILGVSYIRADSAWTVGLEVKLL